MRLNISSYIIIALGCVLALCYFWLAGTLSREVLLVLGGITVVALFFHIQSPSTISYDEAQEIGEGKVRQLQRQGKIPAGEVYATSETEMKSIVYETESPEVEHDCWDVLVVVESSPKKAYLVEVSPFGAVMGTPEIDMPSSFSVRSEPRFTYVRARKPGELAKKEEEKGVS